MTVLLTPPPPPPPPPQTARLTIHLLSPDLWTDAYAVTNFIGLSRTTGDQRFLDLAIKLVDQVHEVLGRHREDSIKKNTWLSGLTEEEGKLHPTIGGLRIGKPQPEAAPGELMASSLEWKSDGVYFHYLTRWAHALNLLSWTTKETRYATMALELLDTAHKKFVYSTTSGQRRMYWKMSVDLSRPLVASQGHHDPLDGLLTCLQLEDTRKKLSVLSGPSLSSAIEDLKSMVVPPQLATDDALGIGGLLCDVFRLSRLNIASERQLLEAIVVSANFGLQRYLAQDDLRQPAEQRLAFRELGLAIGLAGVSKTPFSHRFEPYQRVRTLIENFWETPVNRLQSNIYIEHQDINDVMLATSLAPEGYLNLSS